MFVQSSGHWNNHHTNSSQDPGIAATEAVKPVSNMRLHPRASLKDARGTDKDVDKKAWLGTCRMCLLGGGYNGALLTRFKPRS